MTPKELFGLPPVEPGTQPSVKGAPGSDATGELFVLPASFGQERFWDLDRLNPGNPTWNVPVRFRLQGSLNTTFVAHAFNEIVRRHETLRTTFTLAEGQLSQVIRSVLAIDVPVTDLRQLLKSERDAEVDRLSFEEARRRFDLSVGPLFRVSLLQTENQEHVLLVTPHHSVADYISIGLISNELGALYEAYSRGAEPVLPALTIQYGDFAVWQKEQSTGAIVQKELAYWKEQLKDLPLLEFPTDHPRLASPTYDASITSILLPPKLTDAMKELGNRNGATLFNTMLATLAIVMHQYTGQTDFGVATQVSGRTNVELEPLIGLFINNVVLRTDLSGDPLFSQLLTRVQEVGLQSLANQNVRFEQVLKELRPQDYPSHHTLFRLNFICQRDPVKPLEFAGIKLSVIPSKSQGALYDLNVFLVQRAEGWRLACEYNTDLFELSTITRLLGDYRALMESVIDNSDRHLSEFPLIEGAALYKETVRLKALAFTASPALATGHEATGGGTADGIPAKSAVQNSSPSAANPTEDGGAEIYAMPPSAAQRRFWVLEELAPGNPALHMRACLQLVGALSETALEKSLQILVNRHETLRTTFEMRDNELVQVIAPSRQIPLTVTSLEDGPAAKQESRLAESIRAEVSAPFDLSRGPLIRARLFRMAPQKHVLVITTHHIIVDGWSQNVIQNDLWKAYEALSAGREPQLPPLSIQYADFVHWQEKWLDSDGAREQLAFWRKQLSAPLSVLNIPTDRPPRHRLTSQGGMETMLLPDGLVRSLKDVCQAQGISMFMATLGCFAALLNRYTGQDDVLIGSPVANRRLEAESLIGPFAGPVTLRLNLSHNPTWRELFGRIRDTTVDALGHADFPFEVLIENLDVRSVHGRNPLSQCYFFYQASFLKAREANGLTVNPLPDFALGTFFELQMALLERSEGVRVQLEYSSDLFEPATIRRILQDYGKLLEDMVTGQERRMDQLPIAAPSKVQPAPNTGASPAEIHGKHIAPRDPLEQSLASVWAKVLRVDHVGVRDDFFDLGGHSLAAVRLLTEVQKLAGRTLPLATLFQASTVEAMARLLRSDGWTPSWSSLVPIHPTGSRPPLFLAHGAEGNVLLYQPLIQYMGPDQPVYGLQSRGLDGEGRLNTTIQEMAAQYIKEVMTIQPHGPYYLGGYCLGGAIAFEMAQQFKALGEKVELVVMFDTYNEVVIHQFFLKRQVQFVQNLWFHSANFLSIQSKDRRKFLSEKIDIELTRFKIRLHATYHALQGVLGRKVHDSYPHLAVRKVNDKAVVRYVPQPYAGRVAVIRPRGNFAGLSSPTLGWDKIVPNGLEIHELPVRPKGMLVEPFCRLLADTLKSCLEKVSNS